jgi:hypothetical protein
MPDPKELRDLDRARSRVDKLTEQRRLAILERNRAVETAKQAGHPAGLVYRRAGIVKSTASRARAQAGAPGARDLPAPNIQWPPTCARGAPRI